MDKGDCRQLCKEITYLHACRASRSMYVDVKVQKIEKTNNKLNNGTLAKSWPFSFYLGVSGVSAGWVRGSETVAKPKLTETVLRLSIICIEFYASIPT